MCLETEDLEFLKWARVESDPRGDGWRISPIQEQVVQYREIAWIPLILRVFLMLRDSGSSGTSKMQGLMHPPCLVP